MTNLYAMTDIERNKRPVDKIQKQFERVVKLVSERTGVPVYKILSASRKADAVYARQLWHYILRVRYKHKYTDIGERTDRDHTSVMHSVAVISYYMESGETVKEDIDFINEALNY